MKVLLLQLDGKIPNIALMRISAYHKALRNQKEALGITKRGTLKYVILSKKDDLIESTQALKSVRKIEIEQVSYDFSEKNFSPLAKGADRIVERVVFWRKGKPEAAKDNLVKLLKARLMNIRQIKIVGMDASDQDVTLKLLRNYSVFAEHDYDDFVRDITLYISDFDKSIKSSQHIDSLITLAKTPGIKQILEAPVK